MPKLTKSYHQLTEIYHLTEEVKIASSWPLEEIRKSLNMVVIDAAGGLLNDDQAQHQRKEALKKAEKKVIASLGLNTAGINNLREKIENLPGYKAWQKDGAFNALMDSFNRKVARQVNEKYADPRAWVWFIGGCAMIAAAHEYRVANNIQPKIALKPVKEKAYNAVSELLSCKYDGLLLGQLTKSITYDHLQELRTALHASLVNHEWQKNDKYVHARQCTKEFASFLYIKFDDIPPILVKRFAALLHYPPKNVEKLIESWRQEFLAYTSSNFKK